MPQRKYNVEETLVEKQSKRVILPMSETSYNEVMKDRKAYRDSLDTMIDLYPELFPEDIKAGYTLHDILPESKKMPGIRLRRIKLKQVDAEGQDHILTIVPSFIMPYMMGYTDEVEKALFLHGFEVPHWALTYVFGRNDMYWYRLTERLGRYDLVGTTLKDEDALPENWLADEKHTRFNGEKAYIATTVGKDCVLGAAIALQADTAHLKRAYGYFKREILRFKPNYQPTTVNIDGWAATQNAWQALFPGVVVILCFLHAFLKIRACCKRLPEFSDIQQQVWDIYHSLNPAAFYHQMGDFYHWAQQTLSGKALDAVQKLCAKTGDFLLAFDYPDAYRTSNMIDRHMQPLARCLYSARYFHGHLLSAQFQIRAWALCHNFMPYCPRSQISKTYRSPAHQLNGFIYHDKWLHNLLISTSNQVIYVNHRKR